MTWDEQPIQPAQAPPPAPMKIGGFRRGIVVGTMALGLLALGGAAVVSAADPSASPSPSATTTQPSATQPAATDAPSSTARPKGDCPTTERAATAAVRAGRRTHRRIASPDASGSNT